MCEVGYPEIPNHVRRKAQIIIINQAEAFVSQPIGLKKNCSSWAPLWSYCQIKWKDENLQVRFPTFLYLIWKYG